MTALWWAAGEEIEFPTKAAGVASSTVGGNRRTAYVRAALGSLDGAAAGAVAADGVPITPQTNIWLHCQYLVGGNPLADSPEIGLGRSSSALGGLFVGRNAAPNASKCALFKITSAGVVTKLASEAGTSWAQVLHQIDLQITGFNTASANVKLYVEANAAAIIDWTGDLTGLGFTDLDCIRALSNGTNGICGLSEVILADADTRSYAGVMSMAPNAAGALNTFTSGAYGDVDEIVLDDADKVQSATVGQEFDCALSDITAPGTFAVLGIKLTARALKGASGPGTLQLGINSGGTRNTTDKTLTTALATYERVMVVNPITSAPFTLAEANALELCLKSAT